MLPLPFLLLLLAAPKTFRTPLPIPDLVGAPQADVEAILGKEHGSISGDAAKKICGAACDTLLVYGPAAAEKPTLTTPSTFVYLTNAHVSSVKWIYPGDLAKPDGYPMLRKIFAELEVPLDAQIEEATDPVTADGVTDKLHRKITWSAHGRKWTALVLCPLIRPMESRTGEMGRLRASIMEEYRVLLVESGPERILARSTECNPDATEPFEIAFDARVTPKPVKHSHIVFPDAADGFDGLVVMEFVVGTAGSIESVTPVRGHPAFNENAIAGIKRWRYEPFVCYGKPIRWKSRVAIKFSER